MVIFITKLTKVTDEFELLLTGEFELLLTGDMKVEYDSLKTQIVPCCSWNLVDANFIISMLDPVIDGA